MIVPLPKSQTRHPARAQAPLPLPHKFFDLNFFYKIPPLYGVQSPPKINFGTQHRTLRFNVQL